MGAISHILTTFSRLNFKGTKRKTFKKTIIQSESKTVNSDIGRCGCTKIRQNPDIAKIGCMAKQNQAKYAKKAPSSPHVAIPHVAIPKIMNSHFLQEPTLTFATWTIRTK